MSIAMSDLVEQLQEDIPAESGVPSEEQYERAIRAAVQDFSRRAGQEKTTQISVASGTATYDLPADFLSVIAWQGIWSTDGVLNTPQGLIPLYDGWKERITIRNGQLTIFPTPAYTVTRQLRYKAGWVATVDDYGETYEDMGDEEASIILLKAKSLAQKKKDDASAGSGYKYQLAGLSIDTTGGSGSSVNTAQNWENEYLERVRVYVGNVFLFE